MGSHVVSQFAVSLADLTAYNSPNYEYCGIIPVYGTLIDDARNRIVQQFLMTDADWLMMFDTDVEFNIDTIDRLLDMHKKMNTKAGSGWYYIRAHQSKVPTIFFFMEDDSMSRSIKIDENTPEHFLADAGPSGAMLIHREVFEAMRENNERYFKLTQKEHYTETEDIHFCRLLKKYGYKFSVCRDAHFQHYKVQPL